MTGSKRARAGGGEQDRDVRVTAARLLTQALESKAPVEPLLERARGGLPARDRGLLHELVLGTLRWRRFVDFVLESAASRPLEKIDADLVPILRVAVYQLLYLDRVPSHAVVHSAVDSIKRASHRGAAGFANAILRKVAARRDPARWPVDTGDPIEDLAIETSYPTPLVRRWVERFGQERAAAALASGNRRAEFQLTAMGDPGALAADLAAEGVDTRPAELCRAGLVVVSGDPRVTDAFRSGRFYIQDQASQAAALIPRPQPAERILDVAAAPGGKCFAVLAAEPAARLVATDVSLARLLRLRSNQDRLGSQFAIAVSAGERPSVRGGFDRVVVDLPCSGSGTFARHPELKWRISESELARLAGRSRELLNASADLVGPEGLLCAITCSLEREENEDVIAQFLERRGDFALESLELAAELAPFVVGPGLWRVLPAETHDGFTVHVLKRRGPGQAP